MAISYNTLVAPKGTTGSLLNWIGYTKVDTATVLDESQALLYQMLRVREMRTEYTFAMAAGQASAALPSRFLDPFGKVFDTTNITDYDQVPQGSILRARSYDTSLSGTLDNSPFTTTSGSALVAVADVAHGLNQDSTITITSGGVLNGLTLSGSFPVTSITDANHFVIDASAGTDAVASASGNGGGNGIAWTASNLISGSPTSWGVWDEQIKFDVAFNRAAVCKLLFYRQPLLLSATNQTNFLTNRYPNLLRVACLAAAAQYMKDDEEYTKSVQALTALIGSIAAQDDLSYRGATFGTDTP
jgi:hypothetical protein